MSPEPPHVLVTYDPGPDERAALEQVLAGAAELFYLGGLEGERRRAELAAARVLIGWNPGGELSDEDRRAARSVELVQLISAGTNHVDADALPAGAVLAGNAGAYSEPMAEHALALALALAKRLLLNHARLARGEWAQDEPTRQLRGGVCGIVGYGGIGRAVARLARPLGMRIHALNTSGRTDEPVELVGTLDDLDTVLEAADVLVLALPLDERTRGLIGARELALMKPEAILINVARGAIVDEAALYRHLRANPGFMAGLDTWWSEPSGAEEFRPGRPFLELPNVLGSPHNSAIAPCVLTLGARRAAEKVAEHLRGRAESR